MRILVTDDEEMIRELVRFTLERDSTFEVSMASDGESALLMVREQRPDLIILDVRMPGIDGVEVCRRIRAEYNDPRPTILMLSAMGQDSDVERGLEAGADAYFAKPFSPTELLSKAYEISEKPTLE